MPTLEAVRAHGMVLDDITTMATADLTSLVRDVQREEAPVARDALLQTVPAMVDPFAASMGLVAADFYDQVRVASRAPGRYTPMEAPLPTASRYDSLIRWAASPLFRQVVTVTVVSLLAGGVQRLLMNQARDTVIENARRDPADVRFQRVPSIGCCAFCGLLSTRDDYATRAAAGADFHDYCRCVASPVFGSDEQEMPDFVQDFDDAYEEASTAARRELNDAGSPGFGDSAQHRQLLLSKMRELTGAK